MSTAALLVARIRSRERVMANIVARNPESYRTNRYWLSLQSGVAAYRDALNQLERVGIEQDRLVQSR
jgi:hypothetical protein